ncbi:MAG: hypothetical protein ACE5MK_01675 [Acidobacteriota bacterium]
MTHRPDRRRRVYTAVVLYFIFVFLALMWPIYPFFSRIFPMLLGIPLSLVYLVFLLVLSFLVLLGLYLWEDRHGEIE